MRRPRCVSSEPMPRPTASTRTASPSAVRPRVRSPRSTSATRPPKTRRQRCEQRCRCPVRTSSSAPSRRATPRPSTSIARPTHSCSYQWAVQTRSTRRKLRDSTRSSSPGTRPATCRTPSTVNRSSTSRQTSCGGRWTSLPQPAECSGRVARPQRLVTSPGRPLPGCTRGPRTERTATAATPSRRDRRAAVASGAWIRGVAVCAQRCRKRGLPAIRLHDVRHSYVTALLASGVPLKVVSQRVGHASPMVTMAIYQHVLPGDDRAAADVGGRGILGAP